MQNSNSEVSSYSNESIKLYKYRWVIIILYGVYGSVNFAQFMQFSIITNVVEKYYDVDDILVNMTGVVFMISFIIFFIPIGIMVEKTSLKTTSLVSSGMTAIGNCLKLFATSPDSFYLALVAQTLIGTAQIYMLIIPSKIASAWFGPKEVSTACAIGLFGTQLGVAIGTMAPALIVKDNDDKDIVKSELFSLFLYNAVPSIVFFILVIFFFRSKPPSPPSLSQANLVSVNSNSDKTYNYWKAIKAFSKNKNFLLVQLAIGINYGYWNTLSTLLNQIYTTYFPEEQDNSALGLVSAVAAMTGGCFGSVIFGYIFDRTNKFKLVSFLILTGSIISAVVTVIFMILGNKIGTLIMIPIFGFFNGSLFVVGYEFSTETSYPIPEEFGAAIFNGVVYLFSITFIYAMSGLFAVTGYVGTYIFVGGTMLFGTLSILFVSPNLRRREANMKNNEKDLS